MIIGPLHRKIFGKMPELETRRLLLRAIKLSDAKDMFEYARVPKVSRYTLWRPHRSISETKTFIKFILRNYRSRATENWGIIYKPQNKLIGTVGFFSWDEENRKAEIHYALSNEYAGLGIMTEAVKKAMDFGFKKMRLKRIEAKCMPANKASERVMIKCGMKFEGIARKSLLAKGKLVDLKIYAKIKY